MLPLPKNRKRITVDVVQTKGQQLDFLVDVLVLLLGGVHLFLSLPFAALQAAVDVHIGALL